MTGFLYHLYQGFKEEILFLPSRLIAFVGCLLLLLLPLFIQSPYVLRVMTLASVFAILAASWDLLSGFVGQLSLGHALFFGVAAYTSAFLNLYLGLPPWLTIPMGAVMAVLAGLIIGIPCLRLRGQYLSLATLAFPLILTGIIFIFPDFTGGELGVSGLSRLSESRLADYYITVFLALGLGLLMWKITDSKIGLIFHAIREDEIATRAAGINTTKYKLLAFSLSGFFAGIAGGLYAHVMRLAGPATLDVFMSFQPIIWTAFGGMATIYGAMIGVYLLYPLMEILRIVPEYRMLIFAGIIILVLRIMPQGLSPWVIERLEKECPRCKRHNAFIRKDCRACGTSLDIFYAGGDYVKRETSKSV
ncbi:MAG: branched-chain amino acid ABC transporter permease [Clostridia bacterium]|nr:branched-chain amino acid ABC transporter permease [Clostridia bacterium]